VALGGKRVAVVVRTETPERGSLVPLAVNSLVRLDKR
jgi:hypothetical protein